MGFDCLQELLIILGMGIGEEMSKAGWKIWWELKIGQEDFSNYEKKLQFTNINMPDKLESSDIY